jgi:hypothetical protein
MLFPLPLTPLECYYWYDNRPEYPTAYPIELTFSGSLDREPFLAAVRTVAARHPLLCSRIGEDDHGRPAWLGPDGDEIGVDWTDDDSPIAHPDGEWIDLRRSPGLRIWSRPHASGRRVLLEFHHACCDGLGGLRAVEDLLLAYHDHAAGQAITKLRPIEPERLRSRGSFDEASPGMRTALRDWWIGLKEWSKILSRSPAPLAARISANAEPAGPPRKFLGFVTHTWDRAAARRLRMAATARSGTLNDLLLRDLFLALRQWNARHGDRRDAWLRINMPTALRGREDPCMPASNSLGFTFLTRRARDCDDETRLFDGIRRETEAIKRRRLGLYFLGGLAVGARLGGLMPWILRRDRSFATAVLSNLGNVFSHTPLPRQDRRLVCGRAVLDHVRGVPPVRHLTRASLAVVHYAGVSEVHLRGDPWCFTECDARQLLAEYVAGLDRAAANP